MARTPYNDPDAEQAYQDMTKKSSVPSVKVDDALSYEDGYRQVKEANKLGRPNGR